MMTLSTADDKQYLCHLAPSMPILIMTLSPAGNPQDHHKRARFMHITLSRSCSMMRTFGFWRCQSNRSLEDESSSVGVWWWQTKKGNEGRRFSRVMPSTEQWRRVAADSKLRRERRLLL